MSNYITQVGDKKYYCLDDYYGSHQYWYVKMTEEEMKHPAPWNLLPYKDTEWRWGKRNVLRELPQEHTKLCLGCSKFHKKSEDCILLPE